MLLSYHTERRHAEDTKIMKTARTKLLIPSNDKCIFAHVLLWRGPPLWASGQSSWLQIQGSGFESLSYQIFWDVVGLKRGPLSLLSAIEEVLGTKSSGSGLESREYSRRDPSRWPRGTLYSKNVALTSSTSGSRSFGIVSSRIQVTEFS
jgi:hypothetical protein